MNKKRTLAVYLSGRDEVRLLDLKTLQSKMIVKDEIWAFQNSDPAFLPMMIMFYLLQKRISRKTFLFTT
jgi:hypothetical protein